MSNFRFKTLDEVIECYGRENLIPIDNIRQIIFYTANGCQPEFVCENELKPERITCWFHKGKSAISYSRWVEKNSKQPRKPDA